jgi:dTMP kinase
VTAPSGLLVTFEGVGGSGKSTAAARLVSWFEARGIPVVGTREPGGTALGQHLRGLLLGSEFSVVPWAEAFLFEADRAQTYAEVILPALDAGKMVVSDRNLYGTVAYQAFGRGLDLDLVDRTSWAATHGRRPDLVFVLDIDPAVGLARKQDAGALDRFDTEGLAYLRRVREGYLFAAGRDLDRAVVLDAGAPADEVFERVRAVVDARLAQLPDAPGEAHRP